ncbi:MAG: hypothetical protein RLZZ305_656 [Actinomycetota bacterium]|jgi:protein phosphatase
MNITNSSPTPRTETASTEARPSAAPAVTLRFGAHTDVGRVRAANEDSHRVCTNGAVVCDGLGGHNCGEIASDIASSVIADAITAGIESPEDLGSVIQRANTAVHENAKTNPSRKEMGTTAVALVALPGDVPRVAVANCGDSRAFLYRTGDLIAASVPHNVAQRLIDNGMDPAEAHARWDAHMLTDAIGLLPEVRVDVTVVKVEPGDRFLLATDGLTDMVNDEDIAEALWRHRDPQVCAEHLVALANERGGTDNITVVIADVAPAGAGTMA